MPKCRICHQLIDNKKETENIEWCMPSRNYYYHVKCYEDWRASQPLGDDEWIPMIYDFLARDMKVSYNYFLCESQRKKFIKENKCSNVMMEVSSEALLHDRVKNIKYDIVGFTNITGDHLNVHKTCPATGEEGNNVHIIL